MTCERTGASLSTADVVERILTDHTLEFPPCAPCSACRPSSSSALLALAGCATDGMLGGSAASTHIASVAAAAEGRSGLRRAHVADRHPAREGIRLDKIEQAPPPRNTKLTPTELDQGRSARTRPMRNSRPSARPLAPNRSRPRPSQRHSPPRLRPQPRRPPARPSRLPPRARCKAGRRQRKRLSRTCIAHGAVRRVPPARRCATGVLAIAVDG